MTKKTDAECECALMCSKYVIVWVLIHYKENMKTSILVGVVLGCKDR